MQFISSSWKQNYDSWCSMLKTYIDLLLRYHEPTRSTLSNLKEKCVRKFVSSSQRVVVHASLPIHQSARDDRGNSTQSRSSTGSTSNGLRSSTSNWLSTFQAYAIRISYPRTPRNINISLLECLANVFWSDRNATSVLADNRHKQPKDRVAWTTERVDPSPGQRRSYHFVFVASFFSTFVSCFYHCMTHVFKLRREFAESCVFDCHPGRIL